MIECKYSPLGDNVEEMFIGPFGSSLKNECFVNKNEAYCMVYEQKHAIQKTMNVETRYVNEQKYNELKRFNVRGGDIIVSCRGTIGETYIIPENAPLGIMHPSIMKIRLKEGIYDKYYFNLLLKSRLKKHEAEANGSGIKMAISATELSRELFPVPSMEEQLKITNVIFKISEIIEKRKQELSDLDDLVSARFVELFAERGKVVPLTEYVWFQEGPGVRSVDFTTNGTILLTGSNINDNKLSFGYKSDRFISNELANGKYAHFMCDKDDILVVSSAIAPEKFDKKVIIVGEDKKYCLNTGIIRFKPDPKVMTLGYFREFLKTDYFKHQVMAEMRGIAQMHFGPSHLKKMTILLPESIEQQIQFDEFIKKIDKSKAAVQKSLDETQLLFDSLMQKYFG